jgi:octaprenyl-diphosphate synthase
MISKGQIAVPNHPFAGVFATLEPQLGRLDKFLRDQLASFEPEIRPMVDYCIGSSGKRIRPALVFLSGWKDDGVTTLDAIRAAAVVELIHLATLVHDDIMDGATVRRNRPTAAREYGSTAAVLLGDALFAHALNLATQFPTTEVCAAVSESTRRVCAGEIVQTLGRRSLEVSREAYERVIELKTAELFRVSCFLGSRLSGAQASCTKAASEFGRRLGIAYQIYDDLADYFGQEQRIGKTLGTDLASGKLTLPLLLLAERLSPSDGAKLRDEVAGLRPPDLGLRLRQMEATGVFAAVSEAIDSQLELGAAALEPWKDEPATPHMLRLAELLRGQVAALAR